MSDVSAARPVSRGNVLRLTTSAVMIALAAVLSLVTVVKMPLGGSLTPLSMLPVCILSVRYGTRWGFCTAFLYALVQLFIDLSSVLSWGLTRTALIACILIDYITAFTVLGIAGIFRNKGNGGVLAGIALAIGLRYVCHIISGGTVFSIWCEWDSAWLYSVCYNGAYLVPEGILTLFSAWALLRVPATARMITGSQTEK